VVAETVETQSTPRNDGTMQGLRQQLKRAHNTIAQMRAKERTMIKKIYENFDLYEETLDNGKKMLRRSLPLHRQVKNLYQ
jgi:hypothetical protein